MRSVQFPKQRRRRIWAPQYLQKFDLLRHFKTHLKNTNFKFEQLKKLLNFIGIIFYYKYLSLNIVQIIIFQLGYRITRTIRRHCGLGEQRITTRKD